MQENHSKAFWLKTKQSQKKKMQKVPVTGYTTQNPFKLFAKTLDSCTPKNYNI